MSTTNQASSYDAIVDQARGGPALVTVERQGAHAVVTMDDPERLNPLSASLTLQLQEALRELAADRAITAIVLTGRDPAFSAGGDLWLMRDVAHRMVDDSPRRHDRGVDVD